MKYIGLLLFCLTVSYSFFAQQLTEGLYAKFETSKGEILLKLEPEKAPQTVANFVGLAEGNYQFAGKTFNKPFYDSLKFHRVIANFMIQGGCPLGTGSGDPGYKFYDEFDPTLKHDGPGILSMANSGPNTNGSQFFITHVATPWLDNKHAIFGHVVKGQDVVDKIAQNDQIIHVQILRIGSKYQNYNPKTALEEKRTVHTKKVFETAKQSFPNAKQSATGLAYALEANPGITPKSGDTLTVHYTGYFLSGDKFESSRDGDATPITFVYKTQGMIPGFDEALGMLVKGGKGRFYLPYFLAYGHRQAGPINAYSDLIFEIELVDIKPVIKEVIAPKKWYQKIFSCRSKQS